MNREPLAFHATILNIILSRTNATQTTISLSFWDRVIKYRRLRWAGHVARMEEGRSAFKILLGEPKGKIPLGRPRRRWEDDIRMDLKEIGINTRDWVDLAQDRDYWRAFVNVALSSRFHKPWS